MQMSILTRYQKSPESIFADVETPQGTITSTPSCDGSPPEMTLDSVTQDTMNADVSDCGVPMPTGITSLDASASTDLVLPQNTFPRGDESFSSPVPYAVELSSRLGQVSYGVNVPSNLHSQSNLSNHLSAIRCFLEPQINSLAGDHASYVC